VVQILVVGAGIAGLASARALTRAGHVVEVVERAAGPDRGGAGLYLPGNAVRALRRVGLDGLGGTTIRAQRILDHRGRLLHEIDLQSFWAPCGPCVGVLRADLHRALADGIEVSHGLEPAAIEPGPDAVAVRLSDGSRRDVDLVVGADGIRSAVRRLLGDPRSPHRVGQLSWRFLVELDGVDAWTVLLGRGTSFLLVPVGHGRVYCYADATDAQADQVKEHFAGFADPVPAALDRLADPYAGWIEEAPTPAPTAERVVLVGDAAHATAPNMAQGAAMAVEDALVLAEELGAHGTVGDALAAFTARRRPRTDWVRARAHRRDRTRGLPTPARNAALRFAGGQIYRADYRPLLGEP
jgi:2-polyprenyl-6-methoxyphenol hydroxylase-like FAD-dependent oxidoreductase